jgi:hypothetical protein
MNEAADMTARDLLRDSGHAPLHFSGQPHALFEQHRLFDDIIDPETARAPADSLDSMTLAGMPTSPAQIAVLTTTEARNHGRKANVRAGLTWRRAIFIGGQHPERVVAGSRREGRLCAITSSHKPVALLENGRSTDAAQISGPIAR